MANEYDPKAVADAARRISELNARFLDPTSVPDNPVLRVELQHAAREMKEVAEFISKAATALLQGLGVKPEPELTPFVVSSKPPRGW
jgi:hypothetical protein